MKKPILLLLASLFSVLSATVWASSKDDSPSQSRVLPVLVNVSAQGKVTDASPAYTLRPALMDALRSALDKMISKPATFHGKPVRSQFVIRLALTAKPIGDGTYNMAFNYLSSKALPNGSWYWVRSGDHRLYIKNQSPTLDHNFSWNSLTEIALHQRESLNGQNQVIHENFMQRINQGH
ncbi:hypothetical protein [Oleiagrimonas sp.]|jgi:hypothetical protein|uniref:hypothetical protein n=1 Tax=Oleiagrimonas sp. TaxID=2010330 RepID=UPI002632D057|nr:hypothetical protein [Oleiagrimonas sp.]MDA3913028.1 hypothetical protein [Oleiagrimonas sp.]